METTDLKTYCPSCTSDNVGNTKRLKLGAGVLLFIFGITHLSHRNEYYCYECELTFDLDKIAEQSTEADSQ